MSAPTPIVGYTPLTEEQIALMNKIKTLGVQLGSMVDELMANSATDKRWVSIGKTDLQVGTMALVRSVAQPTTF